MLNNEKAPGSRGRPSGVKVMDGVCEYTTTICPTCQILDYLSTGRDNARTAREIADWIGCKPREVTRLIERARLDGAPVCATCDANRPGYYLAQDAEELAAYLHRFRHRRRTIAKTEAALMATLCTMTGQQVMDLKGGGN